MTDEPIFTVWRIYHERKKNFSAVIDGAADISAARVRRLRIQRPFERRENAEPSFTDGGLYLTATGELSGLGEGDIVVTVVATADVTSSCVNPGNGEHRPPGQNPAPLTVTGSQAIPEGEFKNGTVPFHVSTAAPSPTIAGAPDCPNGGWTETIEDLAFTSATIIVEQPADTVVLTVSCTFSQPTSGGAVPGSRVTCTSS